MFFIQNTYLAMKGNTEQYIILIIKEKTIKFFSNKTYSLEEKIGSIKYPPSFLLFLYQM